MSKVRNASLWRDAAELPDREEACENFFECARLEGEYTLCKKEMNRERCGY